MFQVLGVWRTQGEIFRRGVEWNFFDYPPIGEPCRDHDLVSATSQAHTCRQAYLVYRQPEFFPHCAQRINSMTNPSKRVCK